MQNIMLFDYTTNDVKVSLNKSFDNKNDFVDFLILNHIKCFECNIPLFFDKQLNIQFVSNTPCKKWLVILNN